MATGYALGTSFNIKKLYFIIVQAKTVFKQLKDLKYQSGSVQHKYKIWVHQMKHQKWKSAQKCDYILKPQLWTIKLQIHTLANPTKANHIYIDNKEFWLRSGQNEVNSLRPSGFQERNIYKQLTSINYLSSSCCFQFLSLSRQRHVKHSLLCSHREVRDVTVKLVRLGPCCFLCNRGRKNSDQNRKSNITVLLSKMGLNHFLFHFSVPS